MKKIKSAVAVAALTAGAIASPLAVGIANASVYSLSYIDRCVWIGGGQAATNDCFQLGAYSTRTNSQIWINGKVWCHTYHGNVNFSWCGVGGGNGTGTLNIGDNFTFPHATGSYYERMNLFAGPDQKCDSWGSNSDVNGITTWYTDASGCEGSA
jgi:hypothetical protein